MGRSGTHQAWRKIKTQWDSVGRIKLLLLWEGESGIFGTQPTNLTLNPKPFHNFKKIEFMTRPDVEIGQVPYS